MGGLRIWRATRAVRTGRVQWSSLVDSAYELVMDFVHTRKFTHTLLIATNVSPFPGLRSSALGRDLGALA